MTIDIKKYILDKLFFPKVLVVDRPGIIINKTVSRFGGKGIKTRIIYHFEDIYSDIYINSLKKIGRENIDNLFYKIGKEAGFRYLLLFGKKRISNFLIPYVLDYIFKTLCGAGISFGKNVTYFPKEKKFVIEGSDCVICRKTKNSLIMAGIVSGILSCLFRRNIEAETFCENCPNSCKIIASSKFPSRYIPADISKLTFSNNYYKNNFTFKAINSKYSSFSDLLRFKKISLNHNGKTILLRKIMIPAEIGFSDIIIRNYRDIKEEDILKNSLINSSKSIAKEILKNKDVKGNLEFLCNLISAMGWGIPFYKEYNKKIVFYFFNSPINEYLPFFRAWILNGYLNYIYNKNLKINKIDNFLMEFSF